jgi:hypothetical protein
VLAMIDHVLLFDGPVIAPGARLGPMADVVLHKQVSLLVLLRGAQHAVRLQARASVCARAGWRGSLASR